jgi:LemA protein
MKMFSGRSAGMRGALSPALIVLLVVVGVIVVLGFSLFSWYRATYDRLVALDEGVSTAWAQVENQLQRRYDLIPNLVNTVKGYAGHEEEVLTAVTNARARVGSAQTVGEKMDANRGLTSALGRLLVVMENYPDLKANQNFLTLQAQLEGTENRLAVERRRYNEAVQAYNRTIRQFFARFVAGQMGLERRELFEADKAAAEAPKVKF